MIMQTSTGPGEAAAERMERRAQQPNLLRCCMTQKVKDVGGFQLGQLVGWQCKIENRGREEKLWVLGDYGEFEYTGKIQEGNLKSLEKSEHQISAQIICMQVVQALTKEQFLKFFAHFTTMKLMSSKDILLLKEGYRLLSYNM